MKKGSPAMAIGFNEDVTTEILLRLPVKSILRFKIVSKQWLSIVSCCRFRQIHASGIVSASGLFLHKRSPLHHELVFLPLDNQISPLPYLIPLFDYPIKFRSSSGGLLLMQQPFNLQYFVCNPTTKELKPLFVPQLIRDSRYVYETLAFDPSISSHYKVLFLCRCHIFDKFQIVIYSSETKTFSSPTTISFEFYSRGIYCNDAIHWISYGKAFFYYFDLNRECMNKSPLPPHLVLLYFGESRGHLHLVSVRSTDPRQISLLEVYELKSDYSGWSVKYQVDLASIAIASPQPETYSAIGKCQFTVFSILVDEEEDLNMVFSITVYGLVVAFNFKKKLCNVLRDGDRYVWAPIAYQYIATLACV